MAKRYGRNQRRRHREEIAGLESTLAELLVTLENRETLLEKRTATLRRLEEAVSNWDDDVRRLLGEYSAFRLRSGKLTMREGEVLRRVPLPTDAMPCINFSDSMTLTSAEMLVAYVKRLVVSCRAHPDLKQVIRVAVVDADGRQQPHFNYAIDGRELMTIGRRELPYLVEAIARQFTEALRRA